MSLSEFFEETAIASKSQTLRRGTPYISRATARLR